MPISTRLNTKIRLTMLCLSGFELYSRWVPLIYKMGFFSFGKGIYKGEELDFGWGAHPYKTLLRASPGSPT